MSILAPGLVDTVIAKSLDAASLTVRVVSDNIANVNTPRFKRSEVDFERQLEAALNPVPSKMVLTHPRHMSDQAWMHIKDVVARPVLRVDTNLRNDRNNVDVELEMGKLAKADLLYRSLLQFQGARSGMLRLVITEAR